MEEYNNNIENEEIIDWMAIQYPKLKEIFDKLEV